jgi:transcriptional regulator GlxA family with amidase domain
VLIYPGAQMAAVHGLTDLFGVANRIAADHQAALLPLLRISHWQAEGDQLSPERAYDSHCGAGRVNLVAVLIPPSIGGFTEGAKVRRPDRNGCAISMLDGATLGGVCVGSILLAESGLLDGRSATTHWTSAKAFAERYPKIKLKADTPIVDDGDLITTAGLMAWSELGLRLVDRLLGPSIATATARFLVVEHSDSASACGSNFAPILSHGDASILKVQHWLQSTGATDVSLPRWPSGQGWKSALSCADFARRPGSSPPNTASICGSARPGKCSNSPMAPSITLPGPWAIRTRGRFARRSRKSPGWRRVITGRGLAPAAQTPQNPVGVSLLAIAVDQHTHH